MSKIRVLRVLEYTYPSIERYVEDKAKWGVQGTARLGGGENDKNALTIKSAVLELEVLFSEELESIEVEPNLWVGIKDRKFYFSDETHNYSTGYGTLAEARAALEAHSDWLNAPPADPERPAK